MGNKLRCNECYMGIRRNVMLHGYSAQKFFIQTKLLPKIINSSQFLSKDLLIYRFHVLFNFHCFFFFSQRNQLRSSYEQIFVLYKKHKKNSTFTF